MRNTSRALAALAVAAAFSGALTSLDAAAVATTAATATTASGFDPVTPVRVLDTRVAGGALGPGAVRVVDLSGQVPASTTAVVLNLTGTEGTASTYVTAYPASGTRPTASNVNLTAGQSRPNLVTVTVGADRKVALFNFAGSTHLVADLTGYYATTATGRYTAVSPFRAFDSREWYGGHAPARIGARESITINLGEYVPRSATAVTFTLTGANGSAGTYATAWPTGSPRPTASNLNLAAGEVAPNTVTIALGSNRSIDLYNHNGSVDLVVDLNGFHTPDFGALFTPTPPTRVLDTRSGSGAVGSDAVRDLALPLPARATGVMFNLTGVDPTAGTYVTAWPYSGDQPRSATSTLNLVPGQVAANLAVTGIGENGGVSFYNFSGSVHLVVDVAGYFTLPETAACTTGCVYSWGANMYGSLGTGDHAFTNGTPRAVHGLDHVRQVADNGWGGVALRTDGTVWAWGSNMWGNLGSGWAGEPYSEASTPVPVLGLTDIVQVARNTALRSDGQLFSWRSDRPWWEVVRPYEASAVQPSLSGVAQVAANWAATYALLQDGTVWSWGTSPEGELGTGGPNSGQSTPTQIPGLTGVVEVVATSGGAIARKSDGTVWRWGLNTYGQLGIGGPVPGDGCDRQTFPCVSRTPVQVQGLTGAVAIGADRYHGYAAKSDGTAWAWGMGQRGGLGNVARDYLDTPYPVRVGSLTGIVGVTGSGGTGYAVDSAGRVWAWGENRRNQLGPVAQPANQYTNTPVLLPTPTGVVDLVGSDDVVFALTG